MFEGTEYKMSLSFPNDYPFKPPKVKFETGCFHPNVDVYGNICLDILQVLFVPNIFGWACSEHLALQYIAESSICQSNDMIWLWSAAHNLITFEIYLQDKCTINWDIQFEFAVLVSRGINLAS